MAPYKRPSQMTYGSTTICIVAVKLKLGGFKYFTIKLQYKSFPSNIAALNWYPPKVLAIHLERKSEIYGHFYGHIYLITRLNSEYRRTVIYNSCNITVMQQMHHT